MRPWPKSAATGTSICATGASTRSSWPAPTTRWRQAPHRLRVPSPPGRHRDTAGERRAGVPGRPPLRRPHADPRPDRLSQRGREEHGAGRAHDGRAGADGGVLAILGGVPADAERTVYLCHLYCEFGPTPAVDEFRLVHDFLRTPTRSSCSCSRTSSTRRTLLRCWERSGLAGHAVVATRRAPADAR